MSIPPDTRLRDLGKELLTARRFLRRLGVNVDTGPDMTVLEACGLAGISHEDFLHSLRIMSPEHAPLPTLDQWAQSPPAQLVRHIVDHHHAYARLELKRLDHWMIEVLDSEKGTIPVLLELRKPFLCLKKSLTEHLLLEEERLFPAILAGRSSDPLAIRTLEDLHGTARTEHAAVEPLLRDIVLLTEDFRVPMSASPTLRMIYHGLRNLEEDLVLHIYLENNLLFPMAVAW